MALQLILGSSGQGKTRFMMEEIIRESMKHPTRQYYVLVPEQFGLEMQRQMVEMHPRHGFSNIDVLSFYRLAYRVFEECGYQPKEILEDLGVSMVLKKVLLEHEEEITFFRRSMKHPGFLDQLKSMLFEFMNYGVSALDVEMISEKLGDYPGLMDKCQELSLIYGWFNQAISDHFMVAGQILDVLIPMVSQSKMLQEGYFYLDGYTGFTPIQLDFLRELLPHAPKITTAITIPYIPGGQRKLPKEELFSFSEKSIYALWDLCKESDTEILEPVLLQEKEAARYGENKELAHLEKNMFRQKKEVYKDKAEKIHITICQNPEDEAEYVLHKIEALVRSKGYRYRDFAILMGNETEYPSAFLRESRHLRIPLFVDTNQKMTYHSGVETIRSLFHLVEVDYSYESVFRYLKSGMSDLKEEEIDFLENYVVASGIRGRSMWKKPFSRKLYALEEEQIHLLEELREQVWAETSVFVEGMKQKEANTTQKMTLLYETLCHLHLPDKLKKKSQEAEERGDFVKARGYQIFFKEFLALMDKIVAIFGEEILSAGELADLMDAGLEELALSAPPLSMDQVVLGDLKRTRLPEIKVLFFVGMNDGDMPPVPEDQGILCDDEKRILEENGITLSLNLTERVLEDEYYMYLAFSKPQKELYLTCCQSAADGSAKRPSSLLASLREIYPSVESRFYPEQERRLYFNQMDSRELLIRGLRSWFEGKEEEMESQAFYALLRYWQEEDPEELEAIYRQMADGKKEEKLSEDLVRELYGDEMTGSVTRFEQFAQCPFQYYCNYGLGLEEREEYKIRNIDIGNLFHKALEYFSRNVHERGYRWKEIPEDVQAELIDVAVDAVMDENIRDVIQSSYRNQYKKRMVHRILTRTVEVLRYHLRNSSFEPDQFEMRFGGLDSYEATRIPLANGKEMGLQGVIDRVDLCEEEDRLYLKIIDYKTGTTSFDFNQLYYGLQLQLVVYLNAALEKYRLEKNKAVEPAGLFYYHIQDPIQQQKNGSGDNLWKKFRMSGFANKDKDILTLLENVDGDKESFTARMTNSGQPYKRFKDAHVMSTEDFYRIGDHVRASIKEIGDKIQTGDISVHPYKLKKDTACKFCKYASVCGFEENNKDYEYRLLKKEKAEDIIDKIRKEMD